MTYHQNNGTITSSATEMPERMRLGKDFRGGWSTFAASSDSPVFVRAAAPLTPAEAMARCPEVAALITRAADLRIRLEPVRDDLVFSKRVSLDALGAALAPFTEDAGDGIAPRNGPKPSY